MEIIVGFVIGCIFATVFLFVFAIALSENVEPYDDWEDWDFK